MSDEENKEPEVKKFTHGGARPNSGPIPMVPTDEERKLVQTLAGHGVPHRSICALIRDGIHIDTMYTHFRRDLDLGMAVAQSKVGKTLFQKAVDGDTTASIFYAKTQMGWKDTTVIDNTSSDGSMSPVNYADVLTKALQRKYADD
jgi:hypothetical protein